MFQYFIKRVLLFIPTLLLISLAIFFLNKQAPGDPVELMLTGGQENTGGTNDKSNIRANEEAYVTTWKQLGLNKSDFYFSITQKSTPKDLHLIPKKAHVKTIQRLIAKNGNATAVDNYYQTLKELDVALVEFIGDSIYASPAAYARSNVSQLFLHHKEEKTDKYTTLVAENLSKINTSDIQSLKQKLSTSYSALSTDKTMWKLYIPSIRWNGFDNQYHSWLTGLLTFDLGDSLHKKVPVMQLISQNIAWTMLLSFLSIILAYLISIPLGVFMAKNKGNWKDGFVTTVLFILYSLPSFWIATLLITYLCQPDYLDIFPPYGVGGELPDSMNFFQKLNVRAYHLVLPLFCWTYASFAFLSRQMRGGMIDVMSQDYIRTARSKGLSDSVVTWKHGFKNSLLRIITMFAGIFPAMISGSVVLEVIFSIPGMGKLLFDALVSKDFPIIFSLVMFSAVLTMVGNLFADLMYAAVDPRIRFNKK